MILPLQRKLWSYLEFKIRIYCRSLTQVGLPRMDLVPCRVDDTGKCYVIETQHSYLVKELKIGLFCLRGGGGFLNI